MNELPPVRLKRHSFFFGEPYHGSLYMFCFTIGKRFFRGLRPVMTPQAELERQMNEHYRNITFKGKVTKGKAERITKQGQAGDHHHSLFIHRQGKQGTFHL